MAVGHLRIIAGDWRSRRLKVPDGIRPSQDAHRETLFNVLGDFVKDSLCLDLFAGTGSLGLEALSRGASHVTFVERSRKVSRTLRSNISSLDAVDRAKVREEDVATFLRRPPQQACSIAFVDPPFAACSKPGWWQPIYDLLLPHLKVGGAACCESPSPISEHEGWIAGRGGRIGAAHWVILWKQ